MYDHYVEVTIWQALCRGLQSLKWSIKSSQLETQQGCNLLCAALLCVGLIWWRWWQTAQWAYTISSRYLRYLNCPSQHCLDLHNLFQFQNLFSPLEVMKLIFSWAKLAKRRGNVLRNTLTLLLHIHDNEGVILLTVEGLLQIMLTWIFVFHMRLVNVKSANKIEHT